MDEQREQAGVFGAEFFELFLALVKIGGETGSGRASAEGGAGGRGEERRYVQDAVALELLLFPFQLLDPLAQRVETPCDLVNSTGIGLRAGGDGAFPVEQREPDVLV